jgi:hypothetical protein
VTASLEHVADTIRTAGPWVESPFFDLELARRPQLTEEQRRLAGEYHQQGYVALRGAVPAELCDRIVAETARRLDEPDAVKERRVQDGWRSFASVRELATLRSVGELLQVLYERRPIPFQTLNFRYGTEQRAHADSLHFSSLPARYMCGVWVAFEDVDAGSGPLFYHPGSHRLAELTAYDLGQTVEAVRYDVYEEFQALLMEHLGFEAVEFHASKGDALIWSSNIAHGGRPITRPGSTRNSQVTHYYFADCVYYTPIHSDSAMGELKLRDITDIDTLQHVEHSYNGEPVYRTLLPNGRSRASRERLPDPSDELRRALEEARRELRAVRESRSYRLGHAALQPLRSVARALRGQSPERTR